MPTTSQLAYKVRSEDARFTYESPSVDKLHNKNIESIDEDARIEWSNLIFLPFHPVFQKLVLICVIVKTYVGPLQSVDPYVRCWTVDKNHDFLLNLFIVLYSYLADAVYGIDTLLHIIHRQVTDKAMRREYMPKSAFLLLLDILSLIPFFRLVTQDAECNERTQLYPNLLTYNEFLIIYRVWEYYKLTSTHSYPKLIGGFVIIMYITVNFLTVFWILLTYEGLCSNCGPFLPEHDWRTYVMHKVNKSPEEYPIYSYAVSFVFSHGLRRVLDNILPSTILEFLLTCLLMIAGYIVLTIFVLPKAFSESVLRLKNVCSKYPSVKKIIEETKRRNPSHKAYQHVETYYTTMWRRRSGIVHMPDIMEDMPRYLRVSIKQDLFWPLFHHSPTLRRRSCAFKRFLFECVHISYKLPGERFYAGSQCLSNLYYVKSGVVQLISADDLTTPILSVTSGTIFGDINFLIPHPKRKITIRCLTYCEVLFLTQADLLRALYKFPEDRKAILQLYKDKINHAKKLIACKEQMKDLDRSEAEGIGWIKSRWWQIFDVISTWKKKSLQLEIHQLNASCELPPETSNYHCAKYLGQLVLCTDGQLQTKSMFVNYQFPWILSPYSVFGSIWKKLVICTVYRDATDYQYFVVNLKKYYHTYGIQKDLLKRLEKYLVCHYKYYKGLNVMDRDSFKHEPYEIYWKVQGEVAQKIIGESKMFTYADPSFIRELACASKYVILPKTASINLIGSQCENVTWVVHGYVKSDAYGPNGELTTKFYEPGEMLSVNSLFGKLALRSYTCYTDCEVLFVTMQEFIQIYKRSPLEWYFLKRTIKEFRSKIEEAFEEQISYYQEYQIRHNISESVMKVTKTSLNEMNQPPDPHSLLRDAKDWKEPESKFMQTWLLCRAIIVCVSITNASLKGGIGAQAMWSFEIIGSLCDCIAWIDIILKIFIRYHDSRGLLIRGKGKCLLNYLTKGFLLDIIGVLPWFEVFRTLMTKDINWNDALLINTCCKFAHIYILFAYFDYISDLPTVHVGYRIIKWQVVNILIVMGASHYLMSHCVDYNFDIDGNLINMKYRNACWMPQIFSMPEELDSQSLHLIFTQSIYLAQCGMMSMNIGGFMPHNSTHGISYVLIFLGVVCWIVTCYTLSVLVLACRENTLFQYGVDSLDTFLRNERVEKNMIDKAIAHFRYCWMRTKGINIQKMLNKRIGLVFGQDLSYGCFKTTYFVLDTLLNGGESMQKQLARISSINYFLPGHEIMREMDLVADLFVVHRGRVVLKRDGKKIITLTKGDIFGQLVGTTLRPLKISAEAYTHADVLQLPIKSFQEIITDEVRKTINKNIQSKNDFLATRTWFVENPYDSIEYILRSKKAIHLPWMPKPIKAHYRTWYAWWLYLSWFVGPCITAFIVVILPWTALPQSCVHGLYVVLTLLDILHIANVISEFYSANLIVENNRCVRRIIGFGSLKKWEFYVDTLSLVIPLFNIIDYDRRYQLAKLLRLKWFIDFEYHFCQGFKTKLAPRALKAAIILLLLHIFTCGWIYVACSEEKFPFDVPDFKKLNLSLDFNEWTHPDLRKGGCARPTKKIIEAGDKWLPAFVVPVFWLNDYIIAMTFILLIHTHTSLDAVMALTINQVYYKILITFALYLLDIWILAFTVSTVYTRFRNFYQFDYHVMNLITFLKDSGLCPSLTKVVRKYTEQLWKKYRGNWLPELVFQGPACLREDLFVSLYIHHLNRPSTFRDLPDYFKRQLAARLERTVIFPGKYIVKQGDVFNVTYFIHEGEVEKWSTTPEGEETFVSLIYSNGYFGCIPGLFCTSAFQFSYYTRTVVDLVYLRLQNWEDLLEGYPEIKKTFFKATRALKHEGVKVVHGK
ncbi:unnamed protein product [Arctia plantaginis]|uniref:Cyclic nucleotide-binding domain-containing protein n=1 Tax=Arctia plantaginis TaxID=874455 RepID=A0A8S0ZSW2_ARCPL|nr:unnamed protein product [Arctia plantaginis]